jgi:hypothetical protein
MGVNLLTGALFVAAAVSFWWDGTGPAALAQDPLNLTYLMLACGTVALALALAQGLCGWEPARRALRWLGAKWMIFLYVHPALTIVLERWGIAPRTLSQAILAAGSVAGAGLVASVLAPLKPLFRESWPWVVLLAVILMVAVLPGLSPEAGAVIGGLTGLVFAAYYGALASCVASVRPVEWLWPASKATEPDRLRNRLVRLAVVLTLLALPEIVRALGGRSHEGQHASGGPSQARSGSRVPENPGAGKVEKKERRPSD